MTNREQCGVIQDLLPLVVDNVASQESQQLVEAHLSDCTECKALRNDMQREMRTGAAAEKDDRFIQLCLKVRKTLSWKRVLRTFIALALAVGLLAGGIAYAQYKMYIDWQEYMPQQYSLSINENGLLQFEYASDGSHGYLGYGYGFYQKEKGVFYLTPHISSWPQIFSKVDATRTDLFNDIRVRDGALVYVERIQGDELVFDEETGCQKWKETIQRTEIKELRIGTETDYTVAYRKGDALPTLDSGSQDDITTKSYKE